MDSIRQWVDKMGSSVTMEGETVEWSQTHFLGIYKSVGALPDVCPIGFLTTYLGSLILLPVVLYVVLAIVWSLAEVGPARKSMTTFFILFLGVPLYPLLCALLLAILWFTLGVLGIALVTLGPVFLLFFNWWQLIEFKIQCVAVQSERRARAHVEVEDISCVQLLLGLFMGLFCFCTAGVCAAACTLIKSPILILSGFCRAWYHAIRGWLKLVDNGSCFWWYWFPIILAAWLVFVAFGVCIAILVVFLSALVKLLASAIWPAYVTAGWLRYFGSSGAHRRDSSCGTALAQGFKAGYQVVWASDVLTNTFIIGDFELFVKTLDQFKELVVGNRSELDADCRSLSCLPPVVIGIFQNSWDLAAKEMAAKLGVSKDVVEEAWRSLARQMIRIGREALEEEFITQEWIEGVPSELCIGLPARAMFDTLERSPNDGELVLSSGLIIRADNRPRGDFFDKIWSNLMEARNACASAQLSKSERELVCFALLAGGGSTDDLPPGLAAGVQRFENMPADKHTACQVILRPLIAASLECSRKSAFKDKLKLAVEGITAEVSHGIYRERKKKEEDGPAYHLVVDVPTATGTNNKNTTVMSL